MRRRLHTYFAAVLPELSSVEAHTAAFGTSGDLSYVTVRVAYTRTRPQQPDEHMVCTDVLVLRRAKNDTWEIELQVSRPDIKP